MAPSKINPATSCIALVPRSWEITSRASHAANNTAMMPANKTTGQNCMGTLSLLHSRRPTARQSGGQSVRDGRQPYGARLLRWTTHGDASRAAIRVYHFAPCAMYGLGGALRAPLGPVVAPLVPRCALLPAPTPRLMGLRPMRASESPSRWAPRRDETFSA